VLNLLFTVSLDALEKCLQTLLMLLPQFFHLTDDSHLKIFIHDISLISLLLLDHGAHSICLVIVLNAEENLLLLTHFDKILAITLL
jgi:hypothetical protein